MIQSVVDGIKNFIETFISTIGDFFDMVKDAFENIIEFIGTLIEVINTVFNHTGRMIEYLIKIIPKLYQAITTIPPFIRTFAYITISICVVYAIIGRSHSSND